MFIPGTSPLSLLQSSEDWSLCYNQTNFLSAPKHYSASQSMLSLLCHYSTERAFCSSMPPHFNLFHNLAQNSPFLGNCLKLPIWLRSHDSRLSSQYSHNCIIFCTCRYTYLHHSEVIFYISISLLQLVAKLFSGNETCIFYYVCPYHLWNLTSRTWFQMLVEETNQWYLMKLHFAGMKSKTSNGQFPACDLKQQTRCSDSELIFVIIFIFYEMRIRRENASLCDHSCNGVTYIALENILLTQSECTIGKNVPDLWPQSCQLASQELSFPSVK